MKLRTLAMDAGMLALAGCAAVMTPPFDPRAVPCPTGTCPVSVVARSCSNIDVTPDPISFQRGQQGDIEWTLSAPPRWDFAANPIEIQSAGGNFGSPRKSPLKVQVFNHHNAPGAHKYTVVLVDDRGNECRKDPTILNY